MLEGEQFFKPEEKKEDSPKIKNERIEFGEYAIESVDREANKFHFLQNFLHKIRSFFQIQIALNNVNSDLVKFFFNVFVLFES